RAGEALRIDFFPLRTRPVPIPAEAAFIVAHSLERAEKSGAARGHYNQRVTECALACAVLARRLGCAAAHLGDLAGPEPILADLDDLLPEETTRAALPALTGIAGAELGQRFFPAATALACPDRFRLRARVRHVLSEAARVTAAEAALHARDLRALGALMDASHRSCADDYGVSTPALDRLVELARAGGALGARLTGQLPPRHARHVDVGEHQVGPMMLQLLERFRTTADRHNLVARAPQQLGERVTGVSQIVDHEDPRTPFLHLPRRAPSHDAF